VRLGDVASTIKSSNAGASWLTFDIRFPDRATYEHVVAAQVLTPAWFSATYGVPADDVAVYAYDPAIAIKVTIPRGGVTGGVDETDFDGVQQFAPLLDLELPAP